ncbi:MAG: hypothetical protein WCE79_17560 [Xanthobacteraceae bacterium]
MWGAVIRIGARYAFFRRWKNTIILVGAILLCGVTVFLVDAKMYLSAGFVGALAAIVMFGVASHYIRERREVRERELQKREQAAKRAAAAVARGETINKAKASAVNVAKGVGDGAAGLAGAAKTGFSSARDKLGSWRRKSDEGA